MQIELRRINKPNGDTSYGIYINGSTQIPWYSTEAEARAEYDKIIEAAKKPKPEFEVIKAENI